MRKLQVLKNKWRYRGTYDDDNGMENGSILKDEFKKEGKKFFRKLAKDLGLVDFQVDYNKGGIAVSGDLTLRAMLATKCGIYIHFNIDGLCGANDIYYRSIKHMKDYTGGINHWLRIDETYASIRDSLCMFIGRITGVVD